MTPLKGLIEDITRNPERYSPEDFQFHCGLKTLVSVCRELQEEHHPLIETVESHHSRIRQLSHA